MVPGKPTVFGGAGGRCRPADRPVLRRDPAASNRKSALVAAEAAAAADGLDRRRRAWRVVGAVRAVSLCAWQHTTAAQLAGRARLRLVGHDTGADRRIRLWLGWTD